MYHPGICIEGLRGTTINLSEESQCPFRDPNWALLEHKPEKLVFVSTCSVSDKNKLPPQIKIYAQECQMFCIRSWLSVQTFWLSMLL
jgi:hypothetical protein